MRLLVTGAKGMLGSELVQLMAPDHEALGIDIAELDLTDVPATLAFFADWKPEVVINCAAYTAVDRAEAEPELAYQVNGLAAWAVAEACKRAGAQLVHISTDYVFDGANPGGYDEAALPRPLSVYGASKHYGEVCVQRTLPDCYLVRTQWLYGHGGPNIIDTIARLAKEQPLLRFVNDQHGCLTYTRDLARQIKLLLERPLLPGVYHINNAGHCAWYEVALAVVELLGLSAQVEVQPVTTAEMPRPAPGPLHGLLLRRALELQGADIMPPWRESLADYLRLKEAGG